MSKVTALAKQLARLVEKIVVLERLRQNRIISWIAKFMVSPYYIAIVAAVVLVCHTFGLDIVGFYFCAFCMIFGLLCAKDTKAILAPLMLIAFNISVQNAPTELASAKKYYTSAVILPQLIVLAALMLGSLVVRLIVEKEYKELFTKKRLLAGLVVFAASLTLNGLLSTEYKIMNLMFGLGFGVVYLFLYLFFMTTIKWDKKSFSFLAYVMVAAGLLMSTQLFILFVRNPLLHGGSFDKGLIKLGWGVSNTIGTMMLICLPFALYLLHTRKMSLPFYAMAVYILVAVFFTQSRGTLLFAVPIFIAGVVFSSIFGKNKWVNLVTTAVLAVASVVVFIVFNAKIMEMLRFFLETGFDDRGRFDIWIQGLKDWTVAPVFGVGFMHKFGLVLEAFTFYHNTIIQCLVSGGIVCLCAYSFHRIQTVFLFCKKLTIKRFFLGVALLAFIANSLLDCGTFNFYCIIYYSIMLVFAENDLNQALDKGSDDFVLAKDILEKQTDTANEKIAQDKHNEEMEHPAENVEQEAIEEMEHSDEKVEQEAIEEIQNPVDKDKIEHDVNSGEVLGSILVSARENEPNLK